MPQDEEDLPEVCAVCGVTLTVSNRSGNQQDMCKVCAGETENLDEQVDDFK